MAGDRLGDFHKFMNQFLPMLIQQQQEKKRQDMYLQNALTKYEAFGEQQGKIQDRSRRNNIISAIIGAAKGQSVDQPFPMEFLIKQLEGQLPQEDMGTLNVPDEYEANRESAQAAIQRAAIALQSDQDVSSTDLGIIANTFGQDTTMEILDKIKASKHKTADRGLRGNELTEMVKRTALAEREAGIRENELTLEKTKQSTKGKQSELEKLSDLLKERSKLQASLVSYTGIKADYEPETEAQVEKMTKQIAGLQNKLGMRSDEEYKRLAAQLKAQKFTMEDVYSRPDIQAAIKSQGFEVWVLRGYM